MCHKPGKTYWGYYSSTLYTFSVYYEITNTKEQIQYPGGYSVIYCLL